MDTRSAALEGVELCRDGDWKRGMGLLADVANGRLQDRRLKALAFSYLGYGLARFENKTRQGLDLCRQAAKIELCEPEVSLNLIRIQIMVGDKTGAVRALERGLRLHPGHPILQEFRRKLGVRRKPVVPFLDRSNPLNRFLGQLRTRFFA